MGAGHDTTARELARRFTAAGHRAEVVDLLGLLPAGVGTALRDGYAAMLRRTPWVYDGIYRAFFVPSGRTAPSTSPLVRLAARALRPVIARTRPTAVLSTFHLCGQAAGLLRRQGRLHVPSVVVVSEAVAHALWLEPSTDIFSCLFPSIAAEATRRTGRPAIAPGPVVDPAYRAPRPPAPGRRSLGLGASERAVLIGTGSWGVGAAVSTATALRALPGVRPVLLCGRNERLRTRAGDTPGVLGLGWRTDLPDLVAAADLLIDNAGGSTCLEAFAAGLPVIMHRPVPGHGGPVADALTAEGLLRRADTEAELRAAVTAGRAAGRATAARARGIFAADPAEAILAVLAERYAVR